MLVRFYYLVCFWKKRCMKVAWNCLVSVWKLCAHKAQKCCVRIGTFRLLGIALPLGTWYTKTTENIDVSRLSACFWKFFFRLPNDDATHHRQLGVKRPWVQVSPLGPIRPFPKGNGLLLFINNLNSRPLLINKAGRQRPHAQRRGCGSSLATRTNKTVSERKRSFAFCKNGWMPGS